MNKITIFLSENKKVIFIIGIILFCISTFFAGLIIEKNINSSRELKSKEKDIKTEIKQIDKQINSSSENANLLIDSSNIYKIYAEREENNSIKIEKNIIQIKKENEKNISHIDSLSSDSNIILFSILAKEYNSSSGQY